ncbi:MAG: PleD family two-component system response regulator [Nitrospirae bacterium]|nr:MAG: PleD family two-component system response regulator [Nitrospirota bacterium]
MSRTGQEEYSILIVDDMPLNIQVLNELLQDDYRVFFSTTGADALERIHVLKPDLVLLDIMMPDMDGYEVCRRLKAEPEFKDVPVIFITAMAQEENEAEGLKLGAVDYITKPFNPPIVRLRIKNQLELKRQRDLLARLSSLDGLTGIANRRSFDEYLDREWRRATRTGSPMGLIMLDIDYFKKYNDTYGHAIGDECLKAVAKAFQSALERPADFAARYGGEEFACILPDTDIQGATVIAGYIAEAVRKLAIPHSASPVAPYVTVSIGVSVIQPSPALHPSSLIEASDRKLYEAKHKGRNRISS